MDAAEYLQTLPTELLGALAQGDVDVREVAARLMAERGLDQAGRWVGFEKAAVAWAA